MPLPTHSCSQGLPRLPTAPGSSDSWPSSLRSETYSLYCCPKSKSNCTGSYCVAWASETCGGRVVSERDSGGCESHWENRGSAARQPKNSKSLTNAAETLHSAPASSSLETGAPGPEPGPNTCLAGQPDVQQPLDGVQPGVAAGEKLAQPPRRHGGQLARPLAAAVRQAPHAPPPDPHLGGAEAQQARLRTGEREGKWLRACKWPRV